MKLIDAGVFGKALSEWCSREFDYFKATYGATPKVVSDTLRKVINMLADQPNVDCAPVKHGKWIKPTGMMPTALHGKHACSLCGCFALSQKIGHEELSKYCPNCGAEMEQLE